MLRLEHVSAGRWCSRLILFVAQFSWCGPLLTRALAQPVPPILPPGASAFLRTRLPLCGIGRVAVIDEVGGLRIARWVQNGLDVAAVAQDKLDLASQQLCGRIAALPWGDVIGDACDDIGIIGNPRQIDGRFKHCECTRMGERVGLEDAEQIPMQSGGQARRVVIPVEDIEGRLLLCQSIAVNRSPMLTSFLLLQTVQGPGLTTLASSSL